jgi:hypothetical protein
MQGSQGTHMGGHMVGWAPIAKGALKMAGPAIAVPQGEPFENRLRQRPQPTVVVKAATASKIVSFLMVRFSAAVAGGAWRRRVGGGLCDRLGRASAVGTQLYPTVDDVQTQRVIFFCNLRPTWT